MLDVRNRHSGRAINYFPLETSQRPLFETLGLPADQKRMVAEEFTHAVPRDSLALAYLDQGRALELESHPRDQIDGTPTESAPSAGSS